MDAEKSNVTLTHVVYGLQAASLIIGVTLIIALIINYVKRSEVKGTWLETHFKWQIRTFWWSLLWGIVGFVSFYFLIGIPIVIAAGIWFIYRIVKGWLRLNDQKPMYS